MSTSRRKASDEFMPLPDGQEAHWEVCERILFVYTKLNPGLGYIQVQLKVSSGESETVSSGDK